MKKYYILGGIGLLLLFLLKKEKSDCPSEMVMTWRNLALKLSGRLDAAQILAVIHAQSGGNPSQVYYVGGVWPRYGLMGVPIAWAQEIGFTGNATELMKPEVNIEYGSKILYFMDSLILQAYKTSGISFGYSPGMSANAYSWYANGQSLKISGPNDPILHIKSDVNKIIDLLSCYRREI